MLASLFRQGLGHWRTFEIHIFDAARQLALIARHPFRFFFQRLELTDADNFTVELANPTLTNDEKNLIAAAALFVDLMYFETKASSQ